MLPSLAEHLGFESIKDNRVSVLGLRSILAFIVVVFFLRKSQEKSGLKLSETTEPLKCRVL